MDFLFPGNEYLELHENFRLVGRDQELQRLMSILLRKHANSVIMMGAGGVGCTTLCLGIQAAKKDPDAPFDILKKRLFWMDTDGLFALGDSEKINQAFHRIIARLAQTYDSVLIVEDTRDLIEACRNNGTMHFMNALLLAVRNNDTQVIFETKDEDLDAVLKCHSDMRELFTIMPVDEPVGENLSLIVKAATTGLESHHGIRVTDEAIQAAIEFTNRYQTRDNGLNRAQPERSITLLDRALSAYLLEVHRQIPPGFSAEGWQTRQIEMRRLNVELRDGQAQIAEYEEQREKLAQRERELSTPSPDNARTSIFQHGGFQTPEGAALSGKIERLAQAVKLINSRMTEMENEINAGLALSRAMVLQEFSKISGIAQGKLDQDEIAKLRDLDMGLKKRIFGQDDAVLRISNGIRVFRVGRRSKNKPLSFLFLGPSGVGKTEVSKVLAEALLDDEAALTRFDMSEYMEKHAVAKMIGAPPGYEGFEAGGILTNLMRRNSNRVLLFDEIEKAHPDVFNVLLQVLDEGRLTDNIGRTVSFADAIIIMTTNIGQPHFLDESMSEPEREALAMIDLSNTYRSEFLNRFNGRQNIICFKILRLDSMEKIVRREISSIDAVYGEKGVHVEANDNVIASFCRDQYDPKIGARGLPGFITANLEPHLVNAILADQNVQGTALVDYSTEEKRFDVKIAA